MNQELFEKHLCNSHIPKEIVPRFVVGYVQPVYTAVQNENCSKSTSAIKIATIKNTDDFYFEGKPSHATTKLTLTAVSKDEWHTGKSMKNALQYVKRHFSG